MPYCMHTHDTWCPNCRQDEEVHKLVRWVESTHARLRRADWNWDCSAVLLAIAELQRVRYLIDDDERAECLRTISIRARDALDRIKKEPQWAADEGRAHGYSMGLRRAAEVLRDEPSRRRQLDLHQIADELEGEAP